MMNTDEITEVTGMPVTPEQSVAVCNRSLFRRTALLFNRIIVPMWERGPIEPDVPKDIGFRDPKIEEEIAGEYFFDTLPIGEEATLSLWVSLYKRIGLHPVPVYSQPKTFLKTYSKGEQIAYQAALQHIPLVSEECDWQFVKEFRKDPEAVRKYRDLRLWLHDGIGADSVQHAIDIIGQKIENYRWALRKHGLSTRIGVLKQIFSWEGAAVFSLTTSAATAAGGPIIGAIVGGLSITSEVMVSLAEARIKKQEVSRGTDLEVAVLVDIQEKHKYEAK